MFQGEPPAAVLGIDMGVDLGGQDGAVPQEILDLADIGPVRHQLSGHRMAQHVRGEMGGYPGLPCAFSEHEADGLGGQRLGVPVDEEGAGSCHLGGKHVGVFAHGIQGFLAADGDDAFPMPLAYDSCGPVFEVHILHAERRRLRDPYAGCEHELKHGDVADRLWSVAGSDGFGVETLEKPVHRPHGDGPGKDHVLPQSDSQFAERTDGDNVLELQMRKQPMEDRQFAPDGPDFVAFYKKTDVLTEDIAVNVPWFRYVPFFGKTEELVGVRAIGLERFGCQVALELAMEYKHLNSIG